LSFWLIQINVKFFQHCFLLSLLAAVSTFVSAQNTGTLLPKVIDHAEPNYPPLGRMARISGDVLVRFTTDGQAVINADAETGHELLRSSAVENVKTWKFVTHDPGTFHVTFRYRIISGETDIVFLPEPAIVDISATPPTVSIYCANPTDLGKWKAQLKSPRGRAELLIEINTGAACNEHALDGEVTDAHGQKERIDFAYYDPRRKMLGFAVMLTYSKSERLNTSLIGKITQDKLTGTFVDEGGVTGHWTATIQK
jgi:hypothetical protein